MLTPSTPTARWPRCPGCRAVGDSHTGVLAPVARTFTAAHAVGHGGRGRTGQVDLALPGQVEQAGRRRTLGQGLICGFAPTPPKWCCSAASWGPPSARGAGGGHARGRTVRRAASGHRGARCEQAPSTGRAKPPSGAGLCRKRQVDLHTAESLLREWAVARSPARVRAESEQPVRARRAGASWPAPQFLRTPTSGPGRPGRNQHAAPAKSTAASYARGATSPQRGSRGRRQRRLRSRRCRDPAGLVARRCVGIVDRRPRTGLFPGAPRKAAFPR